MMNSQFRLSTPKRRRSSASKLPNINLNATKQQRYQQLVDENAVAVVQLELSSSPES
jgi:hypothetical protein